MSRYIDADALKPDYYDEYVVGDDEYVVRYYSETQIDNAPSIDIVRCQDCKHWEESQYYPEFMVCTYVKGASFTRQYDDFCSRGERREP